MRTGNISMKRAGRHKALPLLFSAFSYTLYFYVAPIKSNIETKTSPFPINLPYDTVTVYGHITPFPLRELLFIHISINLKFIMEK